MSTTTRRRARFSTLTVSEVRPLTADSVEVTFAVPPELQDDFDYAPGQYVALRTELERAFAVAFQLALSEHDAELTAMAEAAAAVLARALDHGLEEVFALTHVPNLPSRAVARAIGMRDLGVHTWWYAEPSQVLRADRTTHPRP